MTVALLVCRYIYRTVVTWRMDRGRWEHA